MKINLHNYETWFLMYTDNELSVSERQEVEQFVQEHPELNDTFKEFQSLVLTPENAVYEPVTDLIKLNNQPVESLLLRYLDEELTTEEVASVEALIHNDATVAEEWSLLQQTKLQPEHVVFEHKERLYKKPARVVYFAYFRRMAAAAILTGVGIFTGLQLLHRPEVTDVPLVSQTQVVLNTDPLLVSEQQPDEQPEPQDRKASEMITQPEYSQTQSRMAHTLVQPVQPADKPQNRSMVSVVNQTSDVAAQIQKDKSISLENINNTPGNKNQTPNVSYAVSDHQKVLINEENADDSPLAVYAHQQIKPSVRERKNPYAFTLENSDSDDEAVMMIGEEKAERTKAGGFFKKVKRVIERKTNLESKESLLIGSFEIAIR
ncbi:MAG: hypothetical protein KF880_04505 [Ferruginibacter sp.]|nr:hypothetical protein [Ferruginibacter sp.]